MKQPTLQFRVAESWPDRRAPAEVQAQAVQSLVANHTLIVGQSRSGKTNAARRLVEEILNWTTTRVVILDPNADFKLLGHVRRGAEPQFIKRWTQVSDQVGIASPDGAAWGILWNKLSLGEMAAYLRLTPKESFAEYRHLDRHYKYEKTIPKKAGKKRLGTLQEFLDSGYFQLAVGEELERYRLLLQDLAALRVWATSTTTKDLDTFLADPHRAVVVDLSTDDEEVRTITAARTLQALWEEGQDKRKEFLKNGGSWPGTLVVIDEAHLFAPPSTSDPRRRAVCERIERFADQGKKLNLFLMVITQQPGKLHRGVLSECNNRIILRVNETLSLRALEEAYGGSRGRYNGALTFKPGEALVEGALLCDELPPPTTPRGTRFMLANTKEGGGTPKADWALPATI
ncbi:MAG: ATP-binding protein [Vicinamibacterales bacterium]